MSPTPLPLLSVRCVALLYVRFAIQLKWWQGLQNDERSVATSAEQRCERRLKKIFLSTF